MESRQMMVLTPAGTADPSIAIAAIRAGAGGILDLEFAAGRANESQALSRLARFVGGDFGVLIRADDRELLTFLVSTSPRLARVILTGPYPTDACNSFRCLRKAGIEILCEAIDLEEAIAAFEVGIDGIVLKGHEAGGRVSLDTSFVLIQKWRQHADRHALDIPFWVRGGVGPNTAAACLAAGARGAVLDTQFLLARESPLSETARRRVAALDGSETVVLGTRLGEAYRLYSRPDSPAAQELASEQERLLASDLSASAKRVEWRRMVHERIAADPATGAWPVGQDLALAATLATRGVTVAGIVQLVREQANKQLEASRSLRHLSPGAPLARSHGTRFPILQGPMTRVSDTAAFASSVAEGGALPFLALALLRKNETESLLNETKAKLRDKPWGVGILGFVPNEIRAEQLEAIRSHRPPFAIIAGGRPDQAKELEGQGIPTYLHVPSPGLLRLFLKDGTRRFIFEGQECGGHIGPRTSFSLWEAMIATLVEQIGSKPANDLHVVFAGGIHDARSAEMVAA